jgi:hypothetical protein
VQRTLQTPSFGVGAHHHPARKTPHLIDGKRSEAARPYG